MFCSVHNLRFRVPSSSVLLANVDSLRSKLSYRHSKPTSLYCRQIVPSEINKPSILRVMCSTPSSTEFDSAGHDINIADDEIVNYTSFDYDGDLEHARATSQGTYLNGINEGLKPLEEYQDGGYHPIHLGGALGASGRYLVIHKLGHGGFGAMWLCRDVRDSGYVAVKVMAGDVTPDKVPDLALTRLDQSAPGAEYVAIPTDSFTIVGPNGSNQCIVLPVLGPCVSPRLRLSLTKSLSLFCEGWVIRARWQ